MSSDGTTIFFDPVFLAHDPGEHHPESALRLRRILDALDPLPPGVRFARELRPAHKTELLRVHREPYVEAVIEARGRHLWLDDETRLSPESVDAALGAAGACIGLVDAILDGATQNGFALVRPPGHHALPDRGMGFCVFNNIAVAAAHAIARGAKRVLILDWDVHHGNGTQAAFFESPEVLFVDFHQENLFPVGGGIDEAGQGRGLGYTLNVPLPAESSDADYLHAASRLLPALHHWYQPELVLVSAGFDAHARDPEGGMHLSPLGFAALTSLVMEQAARVCGGRVGLILEGGYSPADIGACARGCLDVLSGASVATPADVASSPVDSLARSVVRSAVDRVVAHQSALMPKLAFPS